MNLWDYILIFVIAAALGFALGKVLRDRKKGKTCSGDCASCGGSCKH